MLEQQSGDHQVRDYPNLLEEDARPKLYYYNDL